jgi:tight adherence protein B
VQRHLENIKIGDEPEGEEHVPILKEEGYSTNPAVSDLIRQIPGARETLDLIRQSGKPWSVASVMGAAVACFLIAAAISSLFVPGAIALLLAALVAAVPYVYLFVQRERRFRLCDRLLPDAIDLMARGLRAGHALPAVLQMVGDEVAEPLGAEFRNLHEEQLLGLPLREAVMNMVRRIPRDDTRFLATAVLLQKETGGNLAAILDKTASVARERERLRGQVRIYTAQGRATAWILCCMPFLMFVILSLVSWRTERYLFTDHIGKIAIYTGVILMTCGVILIRRIVNVKV